MKKIKFIIVFLILIVILLVFALINRGSDKNIEDNGVLIGSSEVESPKDLSRLGYQEYFTVYGCISRYMDVLNKKNSSYYGRDENGDYVFTATNEQILANICGLISDRYKVNNNINTTNVLNKIKMLNEKNILTLTSISKIAEGNVNSYVASGFTVNMDDEYLRDVYFIVNLDTINKTFSVEELSGNVNIDNITTDKLDKIEKNDYNFYTDYSVSTEDTISKHVTAFKRIMLAKPELAYKYLDKDYRDKRFGSYDNFYKYVMDNKNYIATLRMTKYQENLNEGYKEYVIIDAKGNYMRFSEKDVFDYTVMLDVYTISLPQFLEQYNKGGDDVKASLNAEKFIQMINAKDYESAYSLLDDSFKRNNFPAIEVFKDYVKKNFFEYNTIDTIKVSKEGNYNICTLSLKNTINDNDKKIERNFVILLKDNTDFKMSFGI